MIAVFAKAVHNLQDDISPSYSNLISIILVEKHIVVLILRNHKGNGSIIST